MGKFRHLVWLMLLTSALHAQPGMLGTQAVNGSYTSYSLNDMGIFRQMRVQATSSAASGTRNWEFYEAAADYDPAWRPYFSAMTLSGYNQPIAPSGASASATYNLGFGGASGLLPAVTSGNYYTFNVTEKSTPGTPLDEHMGVMETSYNPVAITSVTQSPGIGAVYPENSVYVTVTLASTLHADEYVYVRYSTTFNFTSSSLLPVTISGTTGTVEIPCQAASTTIYYYAYTSNRTSAEILADVAIPAIGEYAHDMSTLCINNNGGPNYSYTVLPSIGFCGSYYIPSTCYPTINSFVTALNAGTVGCSVICYVAAGHTETAPAGGINLTQTGTAVKTITFIKNGAGANPIIYAPVGTVSIVAASTVADGVFSLNGSDYITIDGIDIIDNNTTGATMMEYGYALFKASNTDGCQNNTIKNCAITLNNNNSWTGAPLNFEFGATGIMMRNTARTALTTLFTITGVSGRSDNNQFYGNTITNVINGFVLSGYNDVTSPYTYYDQNNYVGVGGLGNTIEKYGNTTATVRSSGVYAIYNNALVVSNNTIGNYLSGGTAHNNTLYGVFVSSPISGNNLQTLNIQNNTISLKGHTGSSRVTGIKVGNASCGATSITIDGNTIEDCTFTAGSTGEFYGIDIGFNATAVAITNNIIQNNVINTTTTSVQYLIYNNTTGSAIDVSYNQMLNNYKTVSSTAGILYGYYSASGSATGTQVFHDNIIDGLGIPSAQNGSVCAVRISSSINQSKEIYNNAVSNITSGTSIATMYSCGYYIDGMNVGATVHDNSLSDVTCGNYFAGFNFCSAASTASTANVSYSCYNNTISNVTTTSTNTGPHGIAAYMPTTGSPVINIYNNNITGLNSTASFSGYIYGIFMGGGSANATLNFYENTLHDFVHTGAATNTIVAGGLIALGGSTVNFYRNSINHITNTGSNGISYGLYITSTGVVNIYNNFIQRLSSTATTNVIGVYGIYTGSSGGFWQFVNNTIALGYDTPLTSTGANFGFTGIYFAPTGVTATVLNNIVYVRGTANGTALGSCIRGSIGTAYTPPASFSLSNNNYYFINNATYNYIYTEGGFNTSNVNGYAYGGAFTDVTRNLNNDDCFNDPATGLYKAFMSPAESNSYYDVPPFAGGGSYPYNLKLTTGATTYAESNASAIPGITIDYEGDARSGSTPDIGADEGDFVPQAVDCFLLPIELMSFSGEISGDDNLLIWTTATEHNTSYHIVERSVTGFDFTAIGSVPAAGESESEITYNFVDQHPGSGIRYYRIRTVDLDESNSLSNVIALDRELANSTQTLIFPNPVHDILTVMHDWQTTEGVQIVVLNELGQAVLTKDFAAGDKITVDVTALPGAVYFIRLIDLNSEIIYSGTFVKE
ncbi:MAG TPA: hypothetical protein PLM27_08990 [Chitinophagales bacterium]|nr:hypothetical protein [Chitinophagales bacterium]